MSMAITHAATGTRIDEIAEGIYRISTPVPAVTVPVGLTFNQFLIVDDEPLLFHTGFRGLFPLTREAIASVMPPERLRHIEIGRASCRERVSHIV
jgi:flavorubredoxin